MPFDLLLLVTWRVRRHFAVLPAGDDARAALKYHAGILAGLEADKSEINQRVASSICPRSHGLSSACETCSSACRRSTVFPRERAARRFAIPFAHMR